MSKDITEVAERIRSLDTVVRLRSGSNYLAVSAPKGTMSELADRAAIIAKDMLTGAIVHDDGSPVDCSNPHVVVLEGAAAAPYLWIIRAWCSKADFDEAPDEPNLEMIGDPKHE